MSAKLMQEGLAALRSGNAAQAQTLFQQITNGGTADTSTWLALAFARVNLGDTPGTLEAVDKSLTLDPRNVRALLFKADHLDRAGQTDAAVSFYQGALKVADGMQQVPPDVQQGLQRAQQVSEKRSREYEHHLMGALQEKGYTHEENSRFAEALDIAFGKKSVFYQQPTRFYYPGLPQQSFFPREQFPWIPALEAATDAIRGELLELLQDEGNFGPYLEHDGTVPQLNDGSNLGSSDWSAFYLWRDGEVVTENASRCPVTMAALEAAPMPMVPGQTPTVLFSKLAPGAAIPPHHGVLNTRLICHLPIIVPTDCGSLRVGNYQRAWREGEAIVFDDSMEHEAWNHSELPRVVLLLDIWRPELSQEERSRLTEMLQIVSAYGAS